MLMCCCCQFEAIFKRKKINFCQFGKMSNEKNNSVWPTLESFRKYHSEGEHEKLRWQGCLNSVASRCWRKSNLNWDSTFLFLLFPAWIQVREMLRAIKPLEHPHLPTDPLQVRAFHLRQQSQFKYPLIEGLLLLIILVMFILKNVS